MPAGKKTCVAKNSKGRTNMQKTLLQQTINIQIPVIHISSSPVSKIKPKYLHAKTGTVLGKTPTPALKI
jgi:hypothetical protein